MVFAPASPDLDLVVLNAGRAPGGKLRRVEMAGLGIDVGAKSFLARRPEATDLVRAVGLADRLTCPATMSASIWTRGTLHPMPVGTFLGVPSIPAAALGVLDAAEIAWAEGERDRPMKATLEDLSVGELVRARFRSAVVEKLVEPLLGGLYAGHADDLSLRATMPQLWEAAKAEESATDAAERAVSLASPSHTPMFGGVIGGVGALAD